MSRFIWHAHRWLVLFLVLDGFSTSSGALTLNESDPNPLKEDILASGDSLTEEEISALEAPRFDSQGADIKQHLQDRVQVCRHIMQTTSNKDLALWASLEHLVFIRLLQDYDTYFQYADEWFQKWKEPVYTAKIAGDVTQLLAMLPEDRCGLTWPERLQKMEEVLLRVKNACGTNSIEHALLLKEQAQCVEIAMLKAGIGSATDAPAQKKYQLLAAAKAVLIALLNSSETATDSLLNHQVQSELEWVTADLESTSRNLKTEPGSASDGSSTSPEQQEVVEQVFQALE